MGARQLIQESASSNYPPAGYLVDQCFANEPVGKPPDRFRRSENNWAAAGGGRLDQSGQGGIHGSRLFLCQSACQDFSLEGKMAAGVRKLHGDPFHCWVPRRRWR